MSFLYPFSPFLNISDDCGLPQPADACSPLYFNDLITMYQNAGFKEVKRHGKTIIPHTNKVNPL